MWDIILQVVLTLAMFVAGGIMLGILYSLIRGVNRDEEDEDQVKYLREQKEKKERKK